jgi:tetratricopeptide (TPR) repeat protein
MRRSDVGLVLLIVALAIPVWMLTGAETAMWMGIAIAPFLAVGLVLGLMMAGVRRLFRRRRVPEFEEDEFGFEDIEDAVEVSPDDLPTTRMPPRKTQTPPPTGVAQPVPQVSSQHASSHTGSSHTGARQTTPLAAPHATPHAAPLATPLASTPQPRVSLPPSRVTPPPASRSTPSGPASTPAPAEPLPAKVTGPAFVGTTPWGAAIVPTSDGGRVIVLVLPVEDAKVYEQAPPFPEGMVRAVIVASWQDKGALAGTRVARLAGLDHVYGVTDTIDRGVVVESELEVRPVREGTEIGGVVLKPDPYGLRATWPDGATAVIGDALPLERVFWPDVGVLIGGFVWSSPGPPKTPVPRVVPVPGVVGSADPHELAELLGRRGVEVSVSGPPRDTPLPELGTEHDVVMKVVSGALDEAELLAKRRLAAELDPERMGFHLAVMALMRGDEEAARQGLLHAAELGVAEASASLAVLLAAQRDPEAVMHAQRALDALPDEPMTLRTAVLVHLQMGDTTGASRILVERGAILTEKDRRELVQLVDRSFRLGQGVLGNHPGHRFPHYARAAVVAAREAQAAGYEGHSIEAERMLRRAVELDPAEVEHVAELGALLSRLERDEDAIAVYDAAIDRGGFHEVLRFNRATCHVRAGQLSEAIVDLQVCVDLVEGWHAARVNLCSALWSSGDREGAARELAVLRAEGAPARWVDALAAQIEAQTEDVE